MAVPKKKISASRRGQRRSHDSLDAVNVGTCPNCGEAVLPHNVCEACGEYRGKKVVKTTEEIAAEKEETAE